MLPSGSWSRANPAMKSIGAAEADRKLGTPLSLFHPSPLTKALAPLTCPPHRRVRWIAGAAGPLTLLVHLDVPPGERHQVRRVPESGLCGLVQCLVEREAVAHDAADEPERTGANRRGAVDEC